jgi:hypothetical protein
MKAGPHSGNSLEEIIKMKLKEQCEFNKFYWGYSGSLCHPHKVQEFCQQSIKNGITPLLVLSQTKSAYNIGEIKKVYEYSIDNEKWEKLPFGVYLWNCRFAITASNLQKVNQHIDLNEYVVATEKGKRLLGEYLRYRINKACAFLEGASSQPRLVKVSYIAEVVFPFCIYLR